MPKLKDAQAVVEEFAGLIDPVCSWWMVCGSIRRGKPIVKDAELVIIPAAALYQRLDRMVLDGVIDKAKYGDRHTTRWGEKYRGVVYRDLRIELFMADALNVGFQTWLRTGPGDANQYVMQKMARSRFRAKDGYMWWADHWKHDGKIWTAQDPHKLAVRSEVQMFDLLGIIPIAPEARSVEMYERRHLFGPSVAAEFAPEDEIPVQRGLL